MIFIKNNNKCVSLKIIKNCYNVFLPRNAKKYVASADILNYKLSIKHSCNC